MQNTIGRMLKEGISNALNLREGQINKHLKQISSALEREDRDAVYRHLSELAGL